MFELADGGDLHDAIVSAPSYRCGARPPPTVFPRNP